MLQLVGWFFNTVFFNWLGIEDEFQSNMDEIIFCMGGHGLTIDELELLEKFIIHGLSCLINFYC